MELPDARRAMSVSTRAKDRGVPLLDGPRPFRAGREGLTLSLPNLYWQELPIPFRPAHDVLRLQRLFGRPQSCEYRPRRFHAGLQKSSSLDRWAEAGRGGLVRSGFSSDVQRIAVPDARPMAVGWGIASAWGGHSRRNDRIDRAMQGTARRY